MTKKNQRILQKALLLLHNVGRCELLDSAANESYVGLFLFSFANFLTTAPWHGEQSNLLGDIRLHEVKSWLNWLLSFILVFSVEETIKLCLFHARKAIWGITWKHFSLAATKSVSVASSQSRRMKPVWKQHLFLIFESCLFFIFFSLLQFDTRSIYLKFCDSELCKTKVPLFSGSFSADVLYRRLHQFHINLAACSREWKPIFVSWNQVGTSARMHERATTAMFSFPSRLNVITGILLGFYLPTFLRLLAISYLSSEKWD